MEEIVPFAETDYRSQKIKFGIKIDDRRRHMYVIGKTGMGKTTLLENMAIADIQAGRGVAIVDPHGEFAEKMISFVPKERVDDVIYFDPGDQDFPIAFNAIEHVDPKYRHLVADGLVGVFQKLWAETWGPRLEYVLRNAILALMEYPDSTLLGIMRILVDKDYRKVVVANIKDPVVKSFWNDEYSRYPDKFQAEAIAPIQNKVGQFLTSPLIRNIVGQTKTAIDLRDVMDNQRILILNLSKGKVGEASSRLLGAMMITKLQLAAMSRIDTPEEDRKDFYLYVDEFQNFATTSFINILSEARKYRLNLILAHQYIEQLDETVTAAVFGNIGTLAIFRVGAADAEALETEFAPNFTPEDLVNLGKYRIYLKLMIDGLASKPFSALTLQPIPRPKENYREEIIQRTRERFGTPREQVEKDIISWAGHLPTIGDQMAVESDKAEGKQESSQTDDDNKKFSRKSDKDDANKISANCWICGRETKVPFEPDGVRPIYCKNCLADIRAGKREPIKVKAIKNDESPKGPGSSKPAYRSPVPPPLPRRMGEVVTKKQLVAPISLSALAPKNNSSDSNSKERKPPDIEGLRELLHGVMREEDSDKNETK
ncbi:MAG: hypothetical protein A3A80_01325 [Candidatus Terrybacteria bacterium RIFCSPLOWO2_01_FULL_44_24]|uniref:Uncharacterized protein n=1 Tax=Candidatus Terrybacteria bacterium RIFCSPHIGHO2_01_FULL_43_35 TaxID=1802361 RepID=A0A1G2PFD9_9BACT|nr:MAG: hypothetical protein A2828_03700 [Candidatus Terrybacteria bacterium RIFCSPHIGHO2_01_FULL_43_35]OHA49955.1 MAG: hypothetical protein A3B75_03600 [Candidatus Terrybacteria bacterium RIFCSPHIGHO2_02_FULL_43_14]OHA51723.1 MAG: hypothetical protein A3A80_01325 [Candidatus Terrybacteria bacterium RIFCSPLOWO2_01_FULL_44_24]